MTNASKVLVMFFPSWLISQYTNTHLFDQIPLMESLLGLGLVDMALLLLLLMSYMCVLSIGCCLGFMHSRTVVLADNPARIWFIPKTGKVRGDIVLGESSFKYHLGPDCPGLNSTEAAKPYDLCKHCKKRSLK